MDYYVRISISIKEIIVVKTTKDRISELINIALNQNETLSINIFSNIVLVNELDRLAAISLIDYVKKYTDWKP